MTCNYSLFMTRNLSPLHSFQVLWHFSTFRRSVPDSFQQSQYSGPIGGRRGLVSGPIGVIDWFDGAALFMGARRRYYGDFRRQLRLQWRLLLQNIGGRKQTRRRRWKARSVHERDTNDGWNRLFIGTRLCLLEVILSGRKRQIGFDNEDALVCKELW